MLTCIVRPVINKKFINFDVTEFTKLSKALPGVVVELELDVNLKKIDPSKLLGSGKIGDLKTIIHQKKIKLLLVDFELTPIQQRNLEKEINIKILDRTGLILEIFSARALSREGVLQVELAHLNYNKSRLVRSWTHLERQRGGMGFLGGPGETQIEADKRAINLRISQIKNQLSKVVKTRKIHRFSREKIPFYTIALVGYTNSGKSSVYNILTNSSELSKDMLFATLDPKMKVVDLPFTNNVILSDTVGFISNLPTHLVESFKATLEEVFYADFIIHVRDISSTDFQNQSIIVYEILEELGITKFNKPILEVWNKKDLFDLSFSEMSQYENKKNVVLVSAKTGEGIEELKKKISYLVNKSKFKENIFLPFTKNKIRSWLFNKKLVLKEEIVDDGFLISVFWNEQDKNKYLKLK
jgi:GTP-binding protein HflX